MRRLLTFAVLPLTQITALEPFQKIGLEIYERIRIHSKIAEITTCQRPAPAKKGALKTITQGKIHTIWKAVQF